MKKKVDEKPTNKNPTNTTDVEPKTDELSEGELDLVAGGGINRVIAGAVETGPFSTNG